MEAVLKNTSPEALPVTPMPCDAPYYLSHSLFKGWLEKDWRNRLFTQRSVLEGRRSPKADRGRRAPDPAIGA
eukprot:1330315-Amorphochlora_amoeboformis.AAC.1